MFKVMNGNYDNNLLNRKISMIRYFRDNFSWIKDVVIVLGMVGVLYLNSHYITVDKFEAMKSANDSAHASIQTTLVSIDKTLALQAQNNALLVDAQHQIKVNTAKLTEVDLRVRNIEELGIASFMKESLVNRARLDVRLSALEAHK
jgi:hypothetical protein